MSSERIQRHIERLLDEAAEASAEPNREVVRDRAQHGLTFDPQNPDGPALLAVAERALGPTNSSPPGPPVLSPGFF